MMSIIHDIYVAVNGGARLEDVIPLGSDITYWERRLNSYDPKAPVKKQKTSPKKSVRRTRRSSYAAMQSVLGRATAELVERVNRPTEPPPSTATILVNNLVSGMCRVVEVW